MGECIVTDDQQYRLLDTFSLQVQYLITLLQVFPVWNRKSVKILFFVLKIH